MFDKLFCLLNLRGLFESAQTLLIVKRFITQIHRNSFRGYSSVGRAPALQAGGQRFEPAYLHHFFFYQQISAK